MSSFVISSENALSRSARLRMTVRMDSTTSYKMDSYINVESYQIAGSHPFDRVLQLINSLHGAGRFSGTVQCFTDEELDYP